MFDLISNFSASSLFAAGAPQQPSPFWDFLTSPATVWVVVPVVAILFWGVTEIIGKIHEHKERMAMIQQGIDPRTQEPFQRPQS